MLVVGALALFAATGHQHSMGDTVWATLEGLGVGSALHDDPDSTLERVISLLISLGGVIVTALLLGIISDGELLIWSSLIPHYFISIFP
jgi:hypothetical protein